MRRSRAGAFHPSSGAAFEGGMRAALKEAARGLGRTSPNPAVGAVLMRDGRVLSTGFHARAGEDHAEVAALRKLGFKAEGCDLYSTLEPCDHYGRTGPCTEAILSAGVRRVVVGARDPDPRVRGRGLRKLARRGIDVVAGVLEAECEALNEAYNFAVTHARPFVVLKAAMSLDGRTATRSGASRYLTSDSARREVHRLRDQLDAIMVGVNTVIADDPELSARLPNARDPVRVVMDTQLRIPVRSRIVATAERTRTIVMTTRAAPARKRKALEARGVEVVSVPKGRGGRVDPTAALEALKVREINSVLAEGGACLHGALVDARLANKVVLFIAPILIGGVDAKEVIGGQGARSLDDVLRLERVRIAECGPDLIVSGYLPDARGPRPR